MFAAENIVPLHIVESRSWEKRPGPGSRLGFPFAEVGAPAGSPPTQKAPRLRGLLAYIYFAFHTFTRQQFTASPPMGV